MKLSSLGVLVLVGMLVQPGSALAESGTSQYRGQVLVGADGTGAVAANFPTTVAGEEVRYVLLVQNGRAIASSGKTKKAKYVLEMGITLNGDVVFLSNSEFTTATVLVALNAATPNSIAVTATGPSESAAIVSIVARDPQARSRGRSVLPLGNTSSLLSFHNAGPAKLALRLSFFNLDGTLAGRSAPQLLASHASATADLGVVGSPFSWTQGAVHIDWARYGGTGGHSTNSTEYLHFESFRLTAFATVGGNNLALDDYGPFPLRSAEFDDLTGGLLD